MPSLTIGHIFWVVCFFGKWPAVLNLSHFRKNIEQTLNNGFMDVWALQPFPDWSRAAVASLKLQSDVWHWVEKTCVFQTSSGVLRFTRSISLIYSIHFVVVFIFFRLYSYFQPALILYNRLSLSAELLIVVVSLNAWSCLPRKSLLWWRKQIKFAAIRTSTQILPGGERRLLMAH